MATTILELFPASTRTVIVGADSRRQNWTAGFPLRLLNTVQKLFDVRNVFLFVGFHTDDNLPAVIGTKTEDLLTALE